MSDEETGPGSYEKIRTHDRYLPSTAEHRSMFEDENLYEGYPLVISLASGRKTRKVAFETSGSIIGNSVKSNEQWLKTIFLIRERAIDKFLVPWIIITLNAAVWVLLDEFELGIHIQAETAASLYNLVLTTALAFLLVFRLNRGAVRWWDTRGMWGLLVAEGRNLSISILEHTNHAPKHRDEAISWLAIFFVSVKQHIRDEKMFDSDELAGFMPSNKILMLSKLNHPGLYSASNITHALQLALPITEATSAAIGSAYSSTMRMMEKHITRLVELMGGLERVKATPLPTVYVTHLRTFLLIYLLSMPFLYYALWGWSTIPAVSLIGFILLGIDGAAAECESPFNRRANHLNMDKFCSNVLNEIEDLYVQNADRRIHSVGENAAFVEN
mmetsp:Transcript_29865/g.34691  ORF Transcript_29865/g.34691 Transcript_29865/m.34691 type:complete len:386 (+) Transcript_29865:300-1457(+)